MANSRAWYFSEILDHEDLQYATDALEAADKAQMADLGLFGLISGGAVTAVSASGTPTATVAAFVGADKNGARVTMAAPLVVTLTNDEAGNPTLPTSGHVKWLTIAVHYAKFGSDHVLDGDGLDVYSTTVETISSEMGQLDVDHNAALNGTLRLIQGTEATTIGAAGRPAVSSPDIIICDLAIDHTGFVIGGLGGVSLARADRIVLKSSGSPMVGANFDVIQYVLVQDYGFDETGVRVRRYLGRTTGGGSPGPMSEITTTNARWDGAQQLWIADDSTHQASLIQNAGGSFTVNAMTSGATSWPDTRHNPGGWDSRITLKLFDAPNGDTTIDANGVVTGNGAQTSYAATRLYPLAGTPTGTAIIMASFVWPQRMAAVPSSQTLTDVDGFSTNVSGVTASCDDVGGILEAGIVATAIDTKVSRRVVAVV